MANTTTVRFSTGANNDNTYRTLAIDYRTPATGIKLTGTTYSYTTSQYETVLNMGTISTNTNLTIATTASTTAPQIGDKLSVYAIGGATCSFVFDTAVFKVQTSNTNSLGAGLNMKYTFDYNGTYFVGSGFSI